MYIVTLASGNGWHLRDLARAAAALGHDLSPALWRDLAARVGGASAGAPLPDETSGGGGGGGGRGGAGVWAGSVALDNADVVLLRTMPAGSLEQIVFRMDAMHRLEGAGVRVVNPPRAIEAAVDKYLALSRLQEAGLPVPETIACQGLDAALQAFECLGCNAVLKPLFGSEGFGITRLTDADLAARAFALLERMGSVIYLQRFIDHGGCDYRLFVLGDRVIAAMRRRSADWRTNVARGGRGEPLCPDPAMAALAVRAAAACGAWMAGVDVVVDAAVEPWVLEVNAVPGWRELSRVTGVDVATEVLAGLAEVQSRSAEVAEGADEKRVSHR